MIGSVVAALSGTLLAAFAPVVGKSQPLPASGTLHGRIADETGTALTDVFVLAYGGPDQTSHTLLPDRNGEFDVQLVTGLYDLFVGGAGFVPFAKKVKIQSGSPVLLKIKLRIDKEHAQS